MNNEIFRLQSTEHEKIRKVLASTLSLCSGRAVFLISPSGQEIASDGEVAGLDSEAICSLAAGALAATFGLATLVGEPGFRRIHHRGEENSVLICPVGNRGLVLLILRNAERAADVSRSLSRSLLVLHDLLERGYSTGEPGD